MTRMSVVYLGQKHCELVHEPSQSRIETDAPKDNQGRGERFSPTDLLGAALGSCVLTIMSNVAERDGVSIEGARADVVKEMVTQPTRKVGSLVAQVTMPKGIPHEYRKKLELAAEACPVKKSLHPDVRATLEFVYPD